MTAARVVGNAALDEHAQDEEQGFVLTAEQDRSLGEAIAEADRDDVIVWDELREKLRRR